MKKIILDTDIGPDCDDAAAIALACQAEQRGQCRLLAIGHCTGSPWGAPAADAICRSYGLEVPVGTCQDRDFLSGEPYQRYNRYLAEHCTHSFREREPEDVVTLYRRILAKQERGSVDFIAIGPLNDLAALMTSRPDAFSPLTGHRLVEEKVCRLVLMAGIFDPGDPERRELAESLSGAEIGSVSEFNVDCHRRAAALVAENWPTPMEYIGFEAGLQTVGGRFTKTLPPDHPLRIAYDRFTQNGERYSWDPVTVHWALTRDETLYRRSGPGRVRFDEEGRTLWTPDPSGKDCYLEPRDGEAAARAIENILVDP